jgi:hypothetical protein
VLPARIEYLSLSSAGVEQQAYDLSHLNVPIFVKFLKQSLNLGCAQVPLASAVVIEWIDPHAGVTV